MQAALEPYLEEWVLLEVKGETCSIPLPLQRGWVALISLEEHRENDLAGTEPALLH